MRQMSAVPMPVVIPLVQYSSHGSIPIRGTMPERTVPNATSTGAATRMHFDVERSVFRSTMPPIIMAATTTVAETNHEGSALMLMPSLSG